MYDRVSNIHELTATDAGIENGSCENSTKTNSKVITNGNHDICKLQHGISNRTNITALFFHMQ